jgi:hypothetical protein
MQTLARIIHATGINYNLVTISAVGMMPNFRYNRRRYEFPELLPLPQRDDPSATVGQTGDAARAS